MAKLDKWESKDAQAARKKQRKQPLPDGVTIVRLDDRVAALRVSIGRVELLRQPRGGWRAFPIVGVKRHPVRRSRVRFTLPDGSARSVYCFRAGERGLTDLGRPDTAGFDIPTFGDDPVSVILAVLLVVGILFALPWFLVQTARRQRVARRLVDAVRGALNLA